MSRVKTVPSDRLETEIFKHLDLAAGDALVLIEGNDFVLVKRATEPPLVERFDKLATEVSEQVEEYGVEPEEVERAVRWASDSS
jgi:hypothetical protein